MKENEPLLKEEKEKLIFNQEEPRQEEVTPFVKPKEKSEPVSVDLSAIMPEEVTIDEINHQEFVQDKEKKEEAPKEDTEKNNNLIHIEEDKENKPLKEEEKVSPIINIEENENPKKDIEIVENKKEIPKEEKPKEEAKTKIKLVPVIGSFVLTLIIVYVFAQAAFNFYIGFKYKDMATVSENVDY